MLKYKWLMVSSSLLGERSKVRQGEGGGCGGGEDLA